MAIGNMHKTGKDHACGSRDMLTDRQTDTHTDVLITILRHRCCGKSNNCETKCRNRSCGACFHFHFTFQ